jgi:uncharacterized membrane protein
MAVDQRTFGERVSDAIAHFGGSWKFIFSFSMVLLVWVVINTLNVFDVIAFDKYPYILLNLILSFVAAFQAPFIMMSQHRAEFKQDQAYRTLFYEIKELVQKDIEGTHSNEQNLRDIKGELKIIRMMMDKTTNRGSSGS